MNWDNLKPGAFEEKLKKALLPIEIKDNSDAVKREGQRVAAVLCLCVKRKTGWQVVLTQRPETMPSHPGQISFPGGKKEQSETIAETALRETEEEIGVGQSDITLIGRLPSFDAVSSYRVTPFIGILNSDAHMIANPGEVEDIFEVPFHFFMNPDNHKPRTVFFDGEDHILIDMPYEGADGIYRNIWGMTAMMIFRLYERLMRPETYPGVNTK